MAGNEDDKKVKELIDAATRAELEKWFGLPSFEQLAEQGVKPAPPEDPETTALLKRRAEAVAAIDPAFVEAHRRRVEPLADLMQFIPSIEPRIDPKVMVDVDALGRFGVAEPREAELPEDLSENLKNCTPQALLRDLHRPELLFDKVFEIVDPIAELRVDVTARVAEVMTARPGLPPPPTEYGEARELLVEIRELRRRSWVEIAVNLPNRRVT